MPITAQNLEVGWQGKAIAKLPEMRIAEGEIVVLGGPNGVGKSTTLKTLCRQIRPLSGTITINGTDNFSLSAQQHAQFVSYVPQLIDFPRHMLVEELVALGRNPHQKWWSWEMSAVDQKAVNEAFVKTETESLRGKRLSELSGGERQRVVIAMALAQQTKFILLDEPTAHLDFKHQMHLVTLLKNLREQGLGMLLVLHDLNLIARLADQVVLLYRSKDSSHSTIAAAGPTSEVLTATNLHQVYEVEIALAKDTASGLSGFIPLEFESQTKDHE